MLAFWLFAIIAVLALSVCWFLNNTFGIWRKKGVPYVKPQLFFGNAKEPLFAREYFGDTFAKLYHELKGHDFGGVFFARTPYFLLRSPELIKTVLVKDFVHFTDRGLKIDFQRDPLEQHLFNMQGDSWKQLRIKLTPTFTSGKIKAMFGLIEECASHFVDLVADLASKDEVVDIKDACGKYTMDVTGTCAFGVQCNSMTGEGGDFLKYGRIIVNPSTKQFINQTAFLAFPQILQKLPLKLVRPVIERFFLNSIKDVITYRKETGLDRQDFIQMLMKVQADSGNKGNGHFNFSDELLAAQCYVFFIAGYETSSATIGFGLTELSSQPHLQERLREEIQTVLKRHDNKITYDAISEMTYLDMVVSEVLRKNPPVSVLLRECTKEYQVPNTNIILEKGTRALVSIAGLHSDPQYFPNPEQFNPDRFNEQNKASRPNFAYMPFGEGPRACIGLRFAIWMAKIAFVALLTRFRFSECSKTVVPIRMDPRSIISSPAGGTWLRVTPL